ncbi:chloride channel protein [Achromobacter xylosoxidans]|jgi:H+/Cl- antiporter ClcA|uniref:Chloride channel protein EriC n=3 Tax=Alcaligenes xylosoxydans xylosoxydans TaxID=85698 RepID=A0A0D6I512_ALCXX|nr:MULTISPECIES: chloride channel protein [Achromobacter]AHC48355.1 putative chloride-channel protein [Achromobacter xylosoxidans NBRC 15126 = ATCC 27061]AUZ18461.1 chloride channel protein EriC [Achromobacter xylosoxidans]AXA78583.1 chloride channel protein EriC [Achromobacter xylosoxidans]EFV87628.1 chloride channel family chloride transporter [Achromobacter xylosoxidans C54]KAA5925779.1 chloride channel protein [Achromobacter xylosoxidans]
MSLPTPLRRVATGSRHLLRRKLRQTNRLSRKSLPMALLLGGAALVALVSLGFAYLADLALEWNREWVGRAGWLALLVLPCALAALRWATLRFAPNAAGSGIPQVIGALSLPPGPSQRSLVSLAQVLWKIPLAFCGMLAGASIGREGPSVQVGAAVMLAWGDFWKRRGLQLRGFHANELLAAGAAGGLAAAFNAPLAGVIFAIEELGRGTVLRWQRLVLIGVLAAGFLVVAVQGNNPYFGTFAGAPLAHGMLWWVLICAALNGALGGIFARLLGKGPAAMAPASWRAWIRAHPIWTAFAMGLALALIGLATAGSVYGTGYGAAADLLSGETQHALPAGFGLAKLAATVASYWAGIPGGIFTPALTTGAGIGHHIWELAGEGVDQRVLVLVSMAAFLAAATQAPLTASVVVMEMTGSQPMLFWLLVGSLLASGVSRQFCPQPFYHLAAGRFRRQAIVEAGRAARTGTSAVR